MTRITAGLLGYVAFLLVVEDLGALAIAAVWGAVTWAAAAAVGAIGTAAQVSLGLLAAPDQLLSTTLPVVLPVTSLAFAAFARWVVWPLTVEHAGAEDAATTKAAEVVRLDSRRRTTEPSRRVAA